MGAALDNGPPWWASAFAAVLLALAAAVARRVVQRSARPQGERLGSVEHQIKEERIRRRQVEAVLLDLGVPLPFWPPDGPHQPRPRLRPAPEPPADDDQADEELQELTRERRVPVPPLDPAVSARHRRP